MTEELVVRQGPSMATGAAVTLRPASRVAAVSASPIRSLLAAARRPGMIVMSGGLPSPRTFPVELLARAFGDAITEEREGALQYGPTEGEPDLRRLIAERETAAGVPTGADEVLVTASSQQALDLVGKAFAEPGRALAVESPTYVGALQAFSLYEPDLRPIACDGDGLRLDGLASAGLVPGDVLYVMPTFQNPTGRTMSGPRRRELAAALRRLDLWAVEDDPYGELWHVEPPPLGLRAHAPDRVVRIRTFSKVLAPGIRLGYVVGPRPVIEVLAHLKQAADLHTSTLAQRAVLRVLASGDLDRHLPAVRSVYREQCEALLAALDEFMPAGVRWTRPAGGMFAWVELPAGEDATSLLAESLERGVAFVPGPAFAAGGGSAGALRLGFATAPPEDLRRGVQILAELVRARGERRSCAPTPRRASG